MSKAITFLRNHPKLVAAIGTAAVGAGVVYGVPPEYSQPLLSGFCKAVGVCN